jgi:hypothetical protein
VTCRAVSRTTARRRARRRRAISRAKIECTDIG